MAVDRCCEVCGTGDEVDVYWVSTFDDDTRRVSLCRKHAESYGA